MKRKVLFFTVDLVPVPGRPTYGGGLRAWGLGQGLAEAGHQVIYSVPAELLPADEPDPSQLAAHAFQANQLEDIIARVRPDVILCEQWGLLDYLPEDGIPIVVDLHGSLILENSYRGQLNWSVNAEAKIRALRKADLVIVPGHRQADYFKPWLMLAGEDPRTLPVVVIPVCMPPVLPEPALEAKRESEPVFVHGGNLWPWVDPLPALDVVADVLGRRETGQLMLFTGHPRRQNVLPQEPPPIPETSSRLASVREHPRVKEHGFIARDQLLRNYLQAHVAVDVYRRNAERELAVTTRTIEYMWAGLPVLYADYAELSRIIEEANAGWLVNPEDLDAIARVTESILDDPSQALEKGENARRLVRERFTWDRAITPLQAFCEEPRRRGKGRTLVAQLDAESTGLRRRLEGERDKLQTTVVELSREVTRLGREYDELKKAYEAHYREMRSKSDELERLRERYDSEREWRDQAIRRLEQEKIDEARWRDEELRRREALAQEVAIRNQTELAAKQQEVSQIHREMTEAVRHRDERYDSLNDRLTEEIRRRGEELRMLGLERAKDVRELNEQIVARDRKLDTAHADLKGIVLQRDDLERLLSEARAEIDGLKLELGEAREAVAQEVRKVEVERARLQEEVERFVEANEKLQRELREERHAAATLRDTVRRLEQEAQDAREGFLHSLAKVEQERGRLQRELDEVSAKLLRTHEEHSETTLERDALRRLAQDRLSEAKRLEKELEETRTSDQLELSRVEEARRELQQSVTKVKADLDETKTHLHRMERERDDFCGQLVTERSNTARLKENFERERQALIAERESYRQSSDEHRADADRQRQHAANLQAGIAGRDDRIRWLEGVLFSMKNRLPNRLYKFTAFWLRRVLLQFPLLCGLYLLNFASNVYMHWWTQRHRQQIFPGM